MTTPDMKFNHLIIITKGAFEVRLDNLYYNTFKEGEMCFLPRNFDASGTTLSDCEMLVLTYDNSVMLCDRTPIDAMRAVMEDICYEFKPLDVRTPLKDFVNSLYFYLDDGVSCAHLHELKQKELFIIFRHYYNEIEKAQFFYYSAFKNNDFMSIVMANYRKAKNAEELAAMCGYNIMTFHRLFKENTGKTPYKWMLQQQANSIRNRLYDSTVPLKVIAAEFKFSSVSHLCTYSKRYLGGTPMKIRKEVRV